MRVVIFLCEVYTIIWIRNACGWITINIVLLWWHCTMQALDEFTWHKPFNYFKIQCHLGAFVMNSVSYLLLRSIPPPAIQHRMITIGFLNDCLFVQVFLFVLLFICLYSYVFIRLLFIFLFHMSFVRYSLSQAYQFLPSHRTGTDFDVIMHVIGKCHTYPEFRHFYL